MRRCLYCFMVRWNKCIQNSNPWLCLWVVSIHLTEIQWSNSIRIVVWATTHRMMRQIWSVSVLTFILRIGSLRGISCLVSNWTSTILALLFYLWSLYRHWEPTYYYLEFTWYVHKVKSSDALFGRLQSKCAIPMPPIWWISHLLCNLLGGLYPWATHKLHILFTTCHHGLRPNLSALAQLVSYIIQKHAINGIQYSSFKWGFTSAHWVTTTRLSSLGIIN